MALIIFIFIILGCLMDSLSMIILAIPFFWPIVSVLDYGLNVDDLKIWFGIIALIVVELGLITPPVGPERLHHPLARAGGPDARDLQGRDAVLRGGNDPGDNPGPLPCPVARLAALAGASDLMD